MAGEFNPFKAPSLSRRGKIIVAAARAIIAESGPEAVTRKRVAERAGLKPAEVSREFHDRAALIRASEFSGEE